MPSPPTTDLPRPKSWDEFEDICADVLKRLWDDPNIVRNGRSGQKQHGVDCYGLPKHLGGASAKKYAGAQCKATDELTFEVVQEAVEKAKEFKPRLTEYLVMTTAPRDAKVQEKIRTQIWPFDRVQLMFWDDIGLELSGHADLLRKHFPGWMTRTGGDVTISANLEAGSGGFGAGGDVLVEGGTGRQGASGGNVNVGPGNYKAGDGGIGKGGDLIIKGGDAE